MLFNLFKSKDDDFIKPPIRVEPKPEPEPTPTESAPAEESAPTPSGSGRMEIEDVFEIKGRGVVVTGKVASGSFATGQKVRIFTQKEILHTTITAIETFHKSLDIVTVGDNAGIILGKEINREQIAHNDILEVE